MLDYNNNFQRPEETTNYLALPILVHCFVFYDMNETDLRLQHNIQLKFFFLYLSNMIFYLTTKSTV
jgi:hypothetical protein